MPEPLVSVLIPCYNAERWIGETLECLVGQTHQNLEIIVVDDGSQDESCQIIHRFTDARIRLIRQQNSCAAKARNLAFQESTGQFVQFLDADDLIAPDKIEKQLLRLRSRPDCIASSQWARFIDSPSEASFSPHSIWKDQKPVEFLLDNWNNGGGMLFPALWLIPKDVAHKAGPWDESLSLNDDGEYFTRIVLASNEVLFCEEARSYYRSSIPGSLSGLKTRAGWESQFKSIELCEAHARSQEDSERVRRSVSVLWQYFAHSCYPYQSKLAEIAIQRAQDLHAVIVQPGGGRAFKLLSKLIGWRPARLMQHRFYRWKYGLH